MPVVHSIASSVNGLVSLYPYWCRVGRSDEAGVGTRTLLGALSSLGARSGIMDLEVRVPLPKMQRGTHSFS